VEDQAIEQLVDHAGVVDEYFRKKLAPGAQIDIKPEARLVETKELPEDAFAAQRGGYFFQVDQGHIGIGRLRHGAEQTRRDVGQELPAAARRQKRHCLGGELCQIVKRPVQVPEGILSQHGLDALGIGIGIENEVGFGVSLSRLLLKGLVQQVIEDF